MYFFYICLCLTKILASSFPWTDFVLDVLRYMFIWGSIWGFFLFYISVLLCAVYPFTVVH